MRYDAETYRLYDDLFQEAHTALCVKEAQKQPGLIRRGLSALFGGGERAGAEELKLLRERVPELEKAIEESAHAKSLLESDVARHMGRAERAEEMFRRVGTDPAALAKAESAGKMWKGVGLGGLGLAGAGIPTAAYLGHQKGEAGKKRTRNLAFGAGAAAGLAAPQIVRGLGHIARGAGQTGLFPELQGYGEY